MTARRDVEFGIAQFCGALPEESPPFIQSVWLTSEGYFYVLRLEDMEVASKKFATGIKVLKARPTHICAGWLRLSSAAEISS